MPSDYLDIIMSNRINIMKLEPRAYEAMMALSPWKESPLFTDEKRTVLKITEGITQIADNGLSENSYERGLNFLGKNGLAQCIMQIVIINSWNRISVSTKIQH